MAYIVRSRFWNDIGYTQDSQFVSSATLPSSSLTLDTVMRPTADKLFSELRVPMVFPDPDGLQYCEISYNINGEEQVFYFWVTSTRIISDSISPITVITISMDLWRTYINKAKIGYGLVLGRPQSVDDPIQPITWRYRTPKNFQSLGYTGQGQGLYWVCLNYIDESTDGKTTKPKTLWFPIDKGNPFISYRIRVGINFEEPCVSLGELIDGSWDEKLGLSPQTVTSCFISPVPPFYVNGFRENIVIIDPSYPGRLEGVKRGTCGGVVSLDGSYDEHEQTLTTPTKTTELHEVVITDLSAVPIASIPWGIDLSTYKMRVIVSQTSCYVEYRFNGINSHAIGTCVSIPVPAVDITSNSWSDYCYSGQRAYDKEQRRIANEQALVSGITGSISGGASSAVIGGLGGKMSAKSAGLLTAGLGIAGSIVDFAFNNMYADQLQNATDQLQAKQLDSIISAGDGWDWVYFGREVGLVEMSPDDYSTERYKQSIKWAGIQCSEPWDDCTPLISAGGPVKISNLKIGGDIPVQAKSYIKSRLEQGVYILKKLS